MSAASRRSAVVGELLQHPHRERERSVPLLHQVDPAEDAPLRRFRLWAGPWGADDRCAEGPSGGRVDRGVGFDRVRPVAVRHRRDRDGEHGERRYCSRHVVSVPVLPGHWPRRYPRCRDAKRLSGAMDGHRQIAWRQHHDVAADRSMTAGALKPGRLMITSVAPSVAGGYPAKRIIGDIVELSAVVVCDGHMELGGRAIVTSPGGSTEEHPLVRQNGYRLAADVVLDQLGSYTFTIEAWIDQAATLESKIARKREAGQDTANEDDRAAPSRQRDHLGLRAVDAPRHHRRSAHRLVRRVVRVLPALHRAGSSGGRGDRSGPRVRLPTARSAMRSTGCPTSATSASTSSTSRRSTRSAASIARASTTRSSAEPGDVGSPWAIGAAEGGHTRDPSRPRHASTTSTALVAAAQRARPRAGAGHRLPVQPRPSVGRASIPSGSRVRPDGTIAYAENPPKRYQDIVPFDFDSADWAVAVGGARRRRPLLAPSRRARVPRRQPAHQAVRVLGVADRRAEAGRPGAGLPRRGVRPSGRDDAAVARRVLACRTPTSRGSTRRGSSQQYFELLAAGDDVEYFRGSAWPNTPDILTEELQQGLPPGVRSRLILAATLSATTGCTARCSSCCSSERRAARAARSTTHGEKYEVRAWDLGDPSLAGAG